jgi:uncharacterized membrane protein
VTKSRTEAFSDGVIAVAITLLALDLKVPSPDAPGTLAHRLGEQWPNYAAYAVSFLTIGIIWINHHAMLSRIARIDHGVLIRNILLLMTIGVLPFSTALMAEYLKAGQGDNLAAVVYGGSFLLMAVGFFAMQAHVLVRKPELLEERVTPTVRRFVLRRNAAGLLPYLIATLGGIISPYITLVICAGIAGLYALPGTTADAGEAA